MKSSRILPILSSFLRWSGSPVIAVPNSSAKSSIYLCQLVIALTSLATFLITDVEEFSGLSNASTTPLTILSRSASVTFKSSIASYFFPWAKAALVLAMS